MKVLSNNGDKYFVELHKDEMANVLGLRSSWDDGFNTKVKQSLESGENIKISEIYNKHQDFNYLLEQMPYSNARKELEKMLEKLEPIEALIASTLVSK